MPKWLRTEGGVNHKSYSCAQWLIASASAVTLLGAMPAAAASTRTIDARTVERMVEQGRTVDFVHRVIVGRLHLPLIVKAPFILQHVVIIGPLLASATTFTSLVDLRGSQFQCRVDFSAATFEKAAVFSGLRASGRRADFDLATFRGLALFGSARFTGRSSFAGAEFDGSTHFRQARFRQLADFDSASFKGTGDFAQATFQGDARFDAAEFAAAADFSNSEFDTSALFAAARFAQQAAFIGTRFYGNKGNGASFRGARFDVGASFLDVDFKPAVSAIFEGAHANGDLIFDGGELPGLTSFATARLLGDTSFSQASLRGVINFDETALAKLDLDGANFAPHSRLFLPTEKGQTGHLDELRLDPGDVTFVGAGQDKQSRSRREHALKLIEAAARRGGDISAANTAYLQRRILLRHDRRWYLRAPDWFVLWLVAGYLVLWWHPLLFLALLLLIGAVGRMRPEEDAKPPPRSSPLRARRALVRIAKGAQAGAGTVVHLRLAAINSSLRRLRSRSFWARVARRRASFFHGLAESIAACWSFKSRLPQGSRWTQAEAVLYAVAIFLLLDSIANVWPTLNNVLKGVLL